MKKTLFSALSFLLIFSGCSFGGIRGSDSTYEPGRSSGEVPLSTTPSSVQSDVPVKGEEVAVIKTEKGDIYIRFFPKEAPKAVENFKTHAKNGYYNGLIFHRVINGFMIQGGDPLGKGTGGESIWKKPFADEFSPNRKNIRGALAMANSGPSTNGSQFFINQVNNTNLNNRHTVFGQVFKGMDIVDIIARTQTDGNDKPVTPVTMNIAIIPYSG